jgi:hypothetical protein
LLAENIGKVRPPLPPAARPDVADRERGIDALVVWRSGKEPTGSTYEPGMIAGDERKES